ncbi:glycosyltransferase [Paenibacillus sp. LjRoot153]|uniref:glycosyltransferase n=1 Tax=Paenibacillus sp. LjRoot153 TaxID=3342270 RepID=UPI003ED0D28E
MSSNTELESTPLPHRRLAVIDTQFPWKLSGFRYWENRQIHAQRPDTIFFATHPYHDTFPTTVYPFSEFQHIAISHGITDVYCVFLNLTLSLLGLCSLPDGSHMPGSNLGWNIRAFLEDRKIKLHSTLYPGGGLEPGTSIEFLNYAATHCSTIFTNIDEVLGSIPSSLYYPVVINTDLFAYSPKHATLPIEVTFCAFNYPRKGFPLLIQAFNMLPEDFHLNIVGDWQDHLHLLTNSHYSFHGLLEPESLRSIYKRTHVFVNCSSQDQFALDGFPTTAAVDAMSTGCILVSTNPRNDRLVLQSGVDYIEVAADAQAIANTLLWIKANFKEALNIGTHGAETINERFDVKNIVRSKLKHMMGNL